MTSFGSRFSLPFATSWLLSTALCLAACGGTTSKDAPKDDSSVFPDGGGVSTDVGGADSGSDDDTDGARVRMMIDVPFMEGSPIDNRFLDPQLSMEAAGNWFEYDPTSETGVVFVEKRVLTRAPAGQATLYVPGKADNPHGVSVVGGVKLANETHEGSIWIGTDGTSTVRASIIAMDPAAPGNSGAFGFAADPASVRDVDGIHWTQYTVAIPKGPIGWGFLIVSLKGTGGTYLHAPVLRATGATTPLVVPSPTGGVGSNATAVRRDPTKRELELVRRALRDGARLPPKPPSPKLP